ncbi:MAG: glycoside hydrolase family 2 TIM barrel-domain containing protein, partial [Bacteroidaceae bacterium]
YVARVSVTEAGRVVDVFDQPFGFRTIQFTHDNGFLLNGKRVELQGTCNHHDLGALGTAVNTTALRRQLRILKSFGCNALRTSHNIPAPEFLDLADKMGMLVLDEAFDCWKHAKKQDDYASLFEEWHERDLEALVCRDRNHPSVIMWSTGNEVAEQYYPETGMARHLTQVVHRFDTTRPVTFGASYPSKSAVNGTELQVDVHGMNYAAGVYGGPDFYGKFLDMEGHENLCGYSSESSSTLSSRGEYFPRKFQVNSYDNREPGWGALPDAEFAALDRYKAICGEFVWTGFDYLGEPTPYNSDASVLLNHAAAMTKEQLEEQREKLEEIERNRPTSRSSYFGIVDLCGFPKDRYYLYQSRWLPRLPMVHIMPHWNFEGKEGKIVPVQIYTSGDEAELFLNGKSLGRKKKGEYQYRLNWDSVVYQPGTLSAVAYKEGKEWATTEVKTTGKAVALKLTPEKTTVASDGDDLVFIRVSCVDSEGNEVPDVEPLITCEATGCGFVRATDNGDATCHVSFDSPVRSAFNGLLLAIVKPHRDKKGKIQFKATSPGLKEASLELKVISAKKNNMIYDR